MRTRKTPLLAAASVLVATLLAACGSSPSAAPASPTAPPVTTTTGTTTTTTTARPTTTTTTPSTAAIPAGHGTVIVLDPGHNGGNASHPAQINALVPAGRGQRKACNTTGTATNAGYPEHAFTWDVALRVRALLVARGFRVVLTRPDDTGVGPCVDRRAAIGNAAGAAAVVSIHADGSTAAGAHGFHVEYSAPALNAEQGAPSVRLATELRDTVHAAGFALANYLGHDGLFGRADLGGLNLSDRPTALIECGNMRDAADAAVLSSASGRARYAAAIAAGIAAYAG